MMLSDADLEGYRRCQTLARSVLAAIQTEIKPGATEASLAEACVRLLNAAGATGYWWYTTPAYVLAGDLARLSIEGDAYRARDVAIQDNDMITIDLHPEIDGRWGDCARSYFLKDGELVTPELASAEAADGMAVEAMLHNLIQSVAFPQMTFRELHSLVTTALEQKSYENLDFLGNFGHSIATDVSDRVFIDANCEARLGSVPLFTFEPHVAKSKGRLAFKYEEIYVFNSAGQLRVL